MAARLLLAFTCALFCGCGGPTMGRVSGRVTVGDEPVREGVIMFVSDTAPAAVGEIKPDGTYTLTTKNPGDGALVGEYRVTISAVSVGPGRMEDPKSIDEEIAASRKTEGKWLVAGKVTWIVPEKFSKLETTDLTATVKGGDNVINFDVPKP